MKQQLHDEYVMTQLEQHNVHWPEIRVAAVVGVQQGNIGEAIAERLFAREDFEAVSGTHEKAHNCTIPDKALQFLKESGAVDTLIVCAADTHLDWIEDYPFGEMVGVIHNTLIAPIVVTQQFVRMTINEPFLKHIVYVGSMAYNRVLNASAPYCAAKAGLAHFSRCMAWELGPKGYRVFTIHPGNVLDTPMTRETVAGIMRYRELSEGEAWRYWDSAEPSMGFLRKEEIAAVVEQLVCDPNMAHLVGSQIELAGGNR